VSSIIFRSFADKMGWKWPREVACVEDGRNVTWDEIMDHRRENQRRRLETIMRVEPRRRAAFVWVYYQPGLFGFAYQGYWLSIRTLNDCWTFNFRGSGCGNLNVTDVMRAFPCGILPAEDNFEQWKVVFSRAYSRPGRRPHNAVVPVWVELDSGRPKSITRLDGQRFGRDCETI
jgi:hypothetical protein